MMMTRRPQEHARDRLLRLLGMPGQSLGISPSGIPGELVTPLP